MTSMHDILKTIPGNRVIIRENVATQWLTNHGQDWDTEAMDILDTLEDELHEVAYQRGIELDYIEAESIACATFNKATD